MDQEKIGKLIKKIRLEKNMSQAQFAQRYGVTFQAVSKWENGKNIPDIAILKMICNDYGYNLDDLLDSKDLVKKRGHHIAIGISVILILFFISLAVIHSFDRAKKFEFKTLFATCEDFNLYGSIAYNDKSSSIYISNITYCGTEDKSLYKKIKCTLYEEDDKLKRAISSSTYDDEKTIELDDFLKTLEFKIDNYEQTCKNYKDNKLYLEIIAHDEQDDVTTYTIPLKFGSNCNSTQS